VSERKRAGIICVGTELTEGIIQDTHVRFMASELTAMRLQVVRAVQIPDSAPIFRAELARAIADCELVIIAGGLGPTSDDLTREIASEEAGMPLEFHEEVWKGIQERFRGRTLSETNRKQAMSPRGFGLIPNAYGTAPGFHGMIGKTLLAVLPGPPAELRPMFLRYVPSLAQGLTGTSADEVSWGTAFMLAESNLEEAFQGCRKGEVSWGTRVEDDRIVFNLRGAVADRDGLLADLEILLGARVRRGDVKPAKLLSEALLARGMMMASAESCTGGLLGKWMTDLPGSSRVYWGGVIAYSNQSKQRLLGIEGKILAEHGAVSRETSISMAEGLREIYGADVGVSVSGVAGPEGGTPDKPVGTVWIAVARRGEETAARVFRFPGSREMIRRRSAVAALLFTEACLQGLEFPQFEV
jgi:nicotinamide-nucleotide amidase